MDHVVGKKSTKYLSVLRAVKLSSDDLAFVRTGGGEPGYVKFLDLGNQSVIVVILSSQLSKKFVFTNWKSKFMMPKLRLEIIEPPF